MGRGPFALPLDHDFSGSGVYAIFYQGSSKIYEGVRSLDSAKPIYVGKAVPPGSRKGGKQLSSARPLFSRLMEHSTSIQNAPSLEISHFRCRYLVVTPLWITMAERFLIEHYKPVWNLCIEGFGNHDPGSGRAQGGSFVVGCPASRACVGQKFTTITNFCRGKTTVEIVYRESPNKRRIHGLRCRRFGRLSPLFIAPLVEQNRDRRDYVLVCGG